MPTDEASAVVAAEVGMSGPRSRGSSDTVSPTVITLPSSACRSVAGEIDWVARLDPVSVTDRAPYTVTGATSTVVFSRRPALDSVTSSSSAVPAGVPAGATPATAAVVREPVSDTASHSRMPSAAMASGCSRTTPRRESERRGVQPGGQARDVVRRRTVLRGFESTTGHVSEPGLRSPSRVIGPAVRLRPADRPSRCRAVVGACRPTPPGARPGTAWCGSRTGCG